MPTPADERLLELLDKWLASLELHLKYAALDDETYWKVQPWIAHQRPSKWILELARQKAFNLRNEVRARVGANDPAFSDAMELAIFLANLVGSQHIERFIPLADPATERWVSQASKQIEAARQAAVPTPAAAPAPAQVGATAAAEATREMPRFDNKSSAAAARTGAAKSSAAKMQPRQQAKSTGKAAGRAPVKSVSAESQSTLSSDARDQVIADAVRLSQWGRKWYELAELISRIADRPSLPEVRRVLKDHKTSIDKKLGR